MKNAPRLSKCIMASAAALLTTGLLSGCGYIGSSAAAATQPARSTHVRSGRLVTAFRKISPVHVLPRSLVSAYQNSPIPITQSAYAHWKAEKGPYVVGFANSNMGNTWRAQSLADLKREFNLLKRKGIVSKLIVANANNDVTTQISQIQDMIAEHVNLILINAASETALNPVIEKAYKAGIVVVAFNNIVSSPYAENRDINQARFGASLAQGLVNILHGKGNIVMVEGIPGAAGSTIRENAALAVFRKYPNIHIIANVSGDWTETGAKTAMLQVLATHPEPINGVWGQGGMTIGIAQALQQAGRPLVPITVTGMNNGIDFWHSHIKDGYKTVGTMDPPVGSAVALRVGVRILEGQHPKLNAIFNNPPVYTNSTLNRYYNPKANPDGWVDPPVYQYVPSKVLNEYFVNGKPIL
ncbi:MAG: substrate-binding domain-containing protein [Firmicutes bacterium]|nr:substrate-binding domain-containing protein [Bacillota bacterium]